MPISESKPNSLKNPMRFDVLNADTVTNQQIQILLTDGGRQIEMRVYKTTFERELEEYLQDCEKRQLHLRTIRKYKQIGLRGYRYLKEGNLTTRPDKIGEREMNYLIEKFNKQKWEVQVFARILRHTGNDVLNSMNLVWPKHMITNRDWLEPNQMDILREEARSGLERTLLALEGWMGLRRISVKRLQIHWIHPTHADVLGKGRMGGKWRTVPMNSFAREVLNEQLEQRSEIVHKALKKDPTTPVAPNLLIHKYRNELIPYEFTQLDNYLIALRKRTGIRFSHHTLRRSFGRNLYKALREKGESQDIALTSVAAILGHDSIDQTLVYLGIALDDMQETMSIFESWERNRKNLPPTIDIWQK